MENKSLTRMSWIKKICQTSKFDICQSSDMCITLLLYTFSEINKMFSCNEKVEINT